jgi:hypothetical protein
MRGVVEACMMGSTYLWVEEGIPENSSSVVV